MESDRVEMTIFGGDGEDCREGIVRGISFDDDRSVRDPVSKYRGSGECFFEYVEGFAGLLGELIRDPLTGKTSEGDHDIGVVENEPSIKVGEAEEGLNILDFPRLGPILYDLDLRLVHGESLGRQNVSEVFHLLGVELTLVSAGVEAIFSESSEHFLNVLPVVREVVGVNEDIVEIDDYGDINHIGEYVVHESLERGGSVGETFGDNQPFERAIARPKRGFSLVSLSYADQMIGVSEVDFRVDAGFAGCVEEIGDKWERITILLRDAV